jgi:hypothetical protein
VATASPPATTDARRSQPPASPKPDRTAAAAAKQRTAARLAEDPRAVAKAAGLNEGDALEPLAVADAFVAATQEFTHPATMVQPVAAAFEAGFGPRTLAASQSLMELNTKVLELWRAQAESTLSLWQGMIGVTSFGEAVQLQTSHLRRHYEETSRRARDIAQTAARMASGLAPEAKAKAEIPPLRER